MFLKKQPELRLLKIINIFLFSFRKPTGIFVTTLEKSSARPDGENQKFMSLSTTSTLAWNPSAMSTESEVVFTVNAEPQTFVPAKLDGKFLYF
jgi:hypothetical protein